MSTNSVVAYLNEDGSVVSSYVHYDGYETGVGMMLLEHTILISVRETLPQL